MFCPVCHAEYRDGFTHCSDCDVDLVRELGVPARFVSKAERDDPDDLLGDKDAMEVLWSGVDPRVQMRITALLDEAGIDYDDAPAKSLLLPASAESVLEVRVFTSDLAAANEAIAESPDGAHRDDSSAGAEVSDSKPSANPFRFSRPAFHPAGADNAEAALGAEHEDDSPQDDYVEQYFDQDEAIAEAWSGDSKPMAQIFRDCLDNIGIGCVIDEENGKVRVLVMPESEKRAKEVVREITEQAPME
jgi:hypothetical protein